LIQASKNVQEKRWWEWEIPSNLLCLYFTRVLLCCKNYEHKVCLSRTDFDIVFFLITAFIVNELFFIVKAIFTWYYFTHDYIVYRVNNIDS